MDDKAGDAGPADNPGTHTKEQPPGPEAVAPVAGGSDIPDPEEDDLDDLDDMLDEFSTSKPEPKKPVPISAPGRPGAQAQDAVSEDEFAKQLQAGMADLLGEIENSPEMQAQLESIFKELGEPPAASAAATSGASASDSKPAKADEEPMTEAAFQETIRRTMERMRAGGEQATAAAEAEGSGDLLADLMKQMGTGGATGEGDEEEFTKMLLGMMEQLTNKDILYEPMKELSEKFPVWLEEHRDKTPAEDLARYEQQSKLAKEIVGKFEEAGYSDENASDRTYIVERMQQIQAAGAPPTDLVGDMPSAQEAVNWNAPDDESCNPQ